MLIFDKSKSLNQSAWTDLNPFSCSMFSTEFQTSLIIVCVVAAIFLAILIWHLCSDCGFYNSYKGVGDRRQRFQKTFFNLQIAESICIYPTVPPTVVSNLSTPAVVPTSLPTIPSGAFKPQDLDEYLEQNPHGIVTHPFKLENIWKSLKILIWIVVNVTWYALLNLVS